MIAKFYHTRERCILLVLFENVLNSKYSKIHCSLDLRIIGKSIFLEITAKVLKILRDYPFVMILRV